MRFLDRFSFKKCDKDSYGSWMLIYRVGSYHSEEQVTTNTLEIQIGKLWVITVILPAFIKMDEIKHYPDSWNEETKKRLGRDYYIEYILKEYGFYVAEDSICIKYGVNGLNHDLCKNKQTHITIPWKAYRFHSLEYFDILGNLFWTEPKDKKGKELWDEQDKMRAKLPKMYFLIEDYDGSQVVATTHLSRRIWKKGTGKFKWLSWFCKDIVQTELEINYETEVGTGKGSWKGGVMGESCRFLPEEKLQEGIHLTVFKRHCDKVHKHKEGKYRVHLKNWSYDRENLFLTEEPEDVTC